MVEVIELTGANLNPEYIKHLRKINQKKTNKKRLNDTLDSALLKALSFT